MFAVDDIRAASALGLKAFRDLLLQIPVGEAPGHESRDALLVLLPLLIVLSTFLFLLLLFLLCVVLLRRRRGIALRDHDGPVDMSREDLVQGEGGFEGVESRWLESVSEPQRRAYLRAKQYQLQYPPNSQPTDITLSQFLSIQEKGVSAWSFDPDYEMVSSLLVHSRTELTFLPDPASATSVQSNLPLPKLNEVYYWEVKMFDLPESTNVAVGLATKPFPSFRLPGHNRYSVAYHSNGDKSHNYPFTATSYGTMLKEGDVLGVGYRPRSGTVFFTRNGRKLEDAFIGLGSWNLFPTIGADGPCSLHVNLGQAGFVFIEANVKKWGLAPSVGTLAPPPAYGSERGSILLESGMSPGSITSTHTTSRRSRRSRPNQRLQTPSAASPLRPSPITSPPPPSFTPPPPITPISEEPDALANATSQGRYISPTDMPFHSPHNAHIPASPPPEPASPTSPHSLSQSPRADSELSPVVAPLPLDPQEQQQVPRLVMPESPLTPGNPPTPNPIDIHLQALRAERSPSHDANTERLSSEASPAVSRREPPAYSPLDAYAYRDGVRLDLPPEIIEAAFERGTIPGDLIPQQHQQRSRRSRRRHHGGSGNGS